MYNESVWPLIGTKWFSRDNDCLFFRWVEVVPAFNHCLSQHWFRRCKQSISRAGFPVRVTTWNSHLPRHVLSDNKRFYFLLFCQINIQNTLLFVLLANPCKTNGFGAPPVVPCFPAWPPFQVGYLWFPSIVLSGQCQTIFTLEEPNQSPFSCQRQQLPWQHAGRSTLQEQDASLERAISTVRTFGETAQTTVSQIRKSSYFK